MMVFLEDSKCSSDNICDIYTNKLIYWALNKEEEPKECKILCKQRGSWYLMHPVLKVQGTVSRSHDSSEFDNVAKYHDQVMWC
jgi:hypothetical protein